jgi:uncharacterized protein (DUF1697 family)
VGGKNKLPMVELAALFTEAGCSAVRTYIQSGHVVFGVAPGQAERVPELIARRIAERFDLRVPVVLRSAEQIREVARGNPFLEAGADLDALHVAFLASKPAPGRVAELDPNRSPPDAFRVIGREVYLFLPGGVARTKLTNGFFDSKLATISTVRNWRTVLKLLEMA